LAGDVTSGWLLVTEAHGEKGEEPGGDGNLKRGASCWAVNPKLQQRFFVWIEASKSRTNEGGSRSRSVSKRSFNGMGAVFSR
jgi:hypothetical protein